MIITEYIQIPITNRNKNIYNMEIGDIYNLSISNLSKGSNRKIMAQCDYCQKEREISYKEYNKNIKTNGKFSCSNKCGIKKRNENNLEKYGVEHTFQLETVKEKIKNTIIDRYGVGHVSNIKEISDKKKSNKQSKETINKIKETWALKDISEIEIINKKRQKTINKIYNAKNISEVKEIKDRKEKTFKEKYGGFTFNSEILMKKVKKTNIERYGTECTLNNKEVKEKSKKTIFDKYGVEYASQNKEIKNKIKNTMLERYGVDNIMFSENFRKTNTIIGSDENYIRYLGGRINEFYCDCGKNHMFEIDTDNYFKRKDRNCKLCTICYPINENVSIKEKELCNFIKNIYSGKIIENYRDGVEIDIYLPDINIGFEFNGLYWHSDKFVHKNKHIDKLNHFKNKGIQIIYIWEDDWDFKKEIIKSQITNWLKLNINKIFARKCIIKEISDVKIVREFLNNNHIQGFIHSSKKIGLFYDNELVSLMTFDRFEGRKKMKENDWNLSRFCSKIYFNIIGGFDKLLKYFINNYKPQRIITYADKEWSRGNLYIKTGFDLVNESNISYKYIIKNKRINKQNFKKKKLLKLYPEEKTSTEREIMMKYNIYRVYDCGQLKFEKLFLY